MASYSAAPPNMVYVAPYPVMQVQYDINLIRDWLVWSIINIFVGWGGGLLPLIFSLVCRNAKSNNDAGGARTMSTLALVFNILATIGGAIGWIYLIIFLAVLSSIHDYT